MEMIKQFTAHGSDEYYNNEQEDDSMPSVCSFATLLSA